MDIRVDMCWRVGLPLKSQVGLGQSHQTSTNMSCLKSWRPLTHADTHTQDIVRLPFLSMYSPKSIICCPFFQGRQGHDQLQMRERCG